MRTIQPKASHSPTPPAPADPHPLRREPGGRLRRRALEILDRLEATFPDARCALDFSTPFELLVATILSAQCTDERVNIVTARLFPRIQGPQDIVAMGAEAFEESIRDVGLFRSKAKSILEASVRILRDHGGQVPRDRLALEALPGVGPKTASVVLSNAFGVPALAVDTHVFRVSHRLGLSDKKTPEKTSADLCALWPKTRWISAHHTLIFHGRQICHARNPACPTCPVLDLCPEGRRRTPRRPARNEGCVSDQP